MPGHFHVMQSTHPLYVETRISIEVPNLSFTQSELVGPALPRAAQLGIHFFNSQHTVRDAPPWGTWLRTLHWWRKVGKHREKKIKKKRERRRSKKPSTRRDSNLWPPDCASVKPSWHFESPCRVGETDWKFDETRFEPRKRPIGGSSSRWSRLSIKIKSNEEILAQRFFWISPKKIGVFFLMLVVVRDWAP